MDEKKVKKVISHQCLDCQNTWTAGRQQTHCPACKSFKINISEVIDPSIVKRLESMTDD
jgi:Zn finger protein HypA/HybF involved in hydrogenase expression